MWRARSRGAAFLLTDYGQRDEFAGVLRAVLFDNAPGHAVIDITHDIDPFDVRGGALALSRAAPYLGPGVVVGVVDPGVGGTRRRVAVETSGEPRYFVGPDNGLLMFAIDAMGGAVRAVELGHLPDEHHSRSSVPGHASATFDGRDVFAPAGAALLCGTPIVSLGVSVSIETLVRLSAPVVAVRSAEDIVSEVLWIDRFGNVQTALRPENLQAIGFEIAGQIAGGDKGGFEVITPAGRRFSARLLRTFSEVKIGIGMIVDANGYLAIVCERASAATLLDVKPGDILQMRSV